jgi:transcriptional regulator with XRE-family HTH domain
MAAATASRYCRDMTAAIRPVGNLLREWRQRRRLSQLELACEAQISTRHLSFLETGRSEPSREMVLRLAEQLDVPMRERNVMLVAAGYAPLYSEKSLCDPTLDTARSAIDLMLEAQKPYPAFAINRHWSIVASNGAIPELYVGVAAFLLQPPINALRLTLHPEGLAPRIANLQEWRAHLLTRLRRQIQVTADPTLIELMRELSEYAAPGSDASVHSVVNEHDVAVPFRILTEAGLLSFFSMTTVFGTPVDITLSELALEFFLPADAATAETVRSMAARVSARTGSNLGQALGAIGVSPVQAT